MKVGHKILLHAALLGVLPLSSKAVSTGSSSGTFVNPNPAKTGSLPYENGQPQYAGVGSSEFTWKTPADLEGRLLITEDGKIYADGSGEHFLTIGGSEANAFGPNVPPGFTLSDFTAATPQQVQAYANSLAFGGDTFPLVKGEQFVVGHLTYHNGTAYGIFDEITLRLETSPASLDNDGDFIQSLDLRLQLVSTTNTDSPEESADYIYLPDYPQFGTFNVLEGETATVELLAEFNSLDPLGFGSVTGSGFIIAATTPDSGHTAWLLATCLAGIVCCRERRMLSHLRVCAAD